MNKTTLDNLLEIHKAQPVGHGYIDIIVSRDNYKEFVSDLVINGFVIQSISWWELCAYKSESEYGFGGPESIFHNGWFSEIPANIDDLNFSANVTTEYIIGEIINKIESKTIVFSDEIATFSQSKWMTPAIWLDVPDDWRNRY